MLLSAAVHMPTRFMQSFFSKTMRANYVAVHAVCQTIVCAGKNFKQESGLTLEGESEKSKVRCKMDKLKSCWALHVK